MRRRLNPETGRAEVLVDTPVGPQWQAAYNAPRPPEASHWSAGYTPIGRQAGVPTSYRTPTSQEEDLFGAEFGSVLGEALKGKQGLVGGGGGQGGGTRQYDIASMTAGMSKYPSLYLRQKRIS